MATSVVRVGEFSPEAISDLLKRLTDGDNTEQISAFSFDSAANINVHIPSEVQISQITPHYMEAFLELQKQLFQFAAFVESGVANATQLSDSKRQELEIAVTVTGGSSNYFTDLSEKLEGLMKSLIKKMDGKQAVITVLGIGALIAAPWSFAAFLQAEKELKIAEFKSKEHVVALEKLSFANEQQVAVVKEVVAALKKQGDIGERALKLAESTNDALLKAASKTPVSTINGATLSGSDAESLRQNTRKQAETHLVAQEITVTAISRAGNTDEFVFLLSSPEEEHKVTLPETLFSSEDRTKLYAALKLRTPIWVELSLKMIDGKVRSVDFLRVTDPPKAISELNK